MNLRRHVIAKNNKIDEQLLDENITKLTPIMIEYLEYYVPLKLGSIFERIGYDGSDTRTELLKKFNEKILSLKVVQLEIKRRKQKRIVKSN